MLNLIPMCFLSGFSAFLSCCLCSCLKRFFKSSEFTKFMSYYIGLITQYYHQFGIMHKLYIPRAHVGYAQKLQNV